MAILFANGATSLLAAPIDSDDTAITVQLTDASRFPTPSGGDYFMLTIFDASGNLEIMRCTGRSGSTLTVQRGQEGTSGVAFSSGSRVENRVTAGTLGAFALQALLGALAHKTSVAAADIDDGAVTEQKLRPSAALSVIGRAGATMGAPADIAASENDCLLARVDDALGFTRLTAAMVPDGLLPFVKMAPDAIADGGDFLEASESTFLTPDAVWDAAASVSVSGTSLTPNLAAGVNWWWELSANAILSVPTGLRQMREFSILFLQDGTGGRTMTWPSSTKFKWAGGSVPALSTAPWAVDKLIGQVVDPTPGSELFLVTLIKGFPL